MAKLSIRPIAPDPAAEARLAAKGIKVFVKGRVFGLIRDATTPHGWRVLGEATTIAGLERKIVDMLDN